ncbi:MAG: PEP-CTERM sorting domain-containing protein [Nibricoccus sp.]
MKKPTHFKRAAAIFTGMLAFVGLSQVANAQLFSISSGKYTINTQGYAASTLTANLSDSAPGGLTASGGGTEDTWGIFQITSILDGATVKYTNNTGYELWGMFYNSVDQSVATFGNQILFDATGLKIDIYRVNVLDTGDTAWQGVFTQGIAGRIDIDSYTGITDVGTLLFQTGIVGNLDSSYNTNSATTNAEGNLALNGVNTLFNLSSIDLSFSLGGTTTLVPSTWTGEFGGPIVGLVENTPVPEPSTYGLMAAGALVGIIALRRRSQKRAQA